jgi:hypothetical protein
MLDEGEKLSNFNMKFLLGIKVSENVSKGTIIYKKEPKTIVITCSMPQQKVEFYLNRPLKLIELTNGEKIFGA